MSRRSAFLCSGLLLAACAMAPAAWREPAFAGNGVVPEVTVVASTDATVTVGPTEPCSDAIAAVPHDGAVELARTGDLESTLAVRYSVGGTARPGADYEALSGLATFAIGSDATRIVIRPVEWGSPGTVVLHLVPTGDHTISHAATASPSIVRSGAGVPCGPPVLGDTAGWSEQVIGTGAVPQPFPVTPLPGATAPAYVASGRFPPGVSLAPDGSFSGSAEGPGSFDSVIGSCTPTLAWMPPPRTGPFCVEAPLHVTVVGGAPAEVPVVTLEDAHPGSLWEGDDHECSNVSAAGVGVGSFTVRRSGTTDGPLTVRYSTGGSARVGVDYGELSGEAILAAGAPTTTIRVVPRWSSANPPVHERREVSISVALKAGDGYAAGGESRVEVPLAFDREVFGCPGSSLQPPVVAAEQVTRASGSGLVATGRSALPATGAPTSLGALATAGAGLAAGGGLLQRRARRSTTRTPHRGGKRR